MNGMNRRGFLSFLFAAPLAAVATASPSVGHPPWVSLGGLRFTRGKTRTFMGAVYTKKEWLNRPKFFRPKTSPAVRARHEQHHRS